MNNIKTQNITFWTKNVPGIDDVSRGAGDQPAFYETVDAIRFRNEPYLQPLLDRFVQKGDATLEIGFGLGTDLRYFARKGACVTGMDYSPENARLATKGFSVMNLPGRAISGDAECLPFPDNSFDAIYSWGCLHHTPDTEKTIREVHRAVRPGGRVMVMLYHKGYQYLALLFSYVVGFKWLRMPLQEHLSRGYDQTPLSRMFSRPELCRLFKDFKGIEITVVTFGGIQYHPVLKYVWRVLNALPFLMRRWGSFAVITCVKAGENDRLGKAPDPVCSLCHSPLQSHNNTALRCVNPKCGKTFPIYAERVPVLHPDGEDLLARLHTSVGKLT